MPNLATLPSVSAPSSKGTPVSKGTPAPARNAATPDRRDFGALLERPAANALPPPPPRANAERPAAPSRADQTAPRDQASPKDKAGNPSTPAPSASTDKSAGKSKGKSETNAADEAASADGASEAQDPAIAADAALVPAPVQVPTAATPEQLLLAAITGATTATETDAAQPTDAQQTDGDAEAGANSNSTGAANAAATTAGGVLSALTPRDTQGQVAMPVLTALTSTTATNTAFATATEAAMSQAVNQAANDDAAAQLKPAVATDGADASADPAVLTATASPAASANPRAAAADVAATLVAAIPQGDAMQGNAANTFNAHMASAAPTAAPAPNLVAVAPQVSVPLDGLAVSIAAHARGGNSQFDIRLEPAELGRIDVRLSIDRNGAVTSHLIVEKAETLDMLRRDAPNLQRALDDAGLKTGSGGLQFSLRDQSHSGGRDDGGARHNHHHHLVVSDDAIATEIAGRSYGRALGASGGLDIRI